MIDNLKKILAEVQKHRENMTLGTISFLVDNWIKITQSLIIELSFLEEENEN